MEPKYILICEPVLLCFDSDRGTWVSADASKDGPGAMLFQRTEEMHLAFYGICYKTGDSLNENMPDSE